MSGNLAWKLAIASFIAAHLLAGCASSRRSTSPPPLPTPVEIDGWEMLTHLAPRTSYQEPESAEAWELAWTALAEDRLAQTHRLASVLASHDSTSPELAALQGFLALKTGSWPEAERHFQAARDADYFSQNVHISSAGGLFLLALNEQRLEAAFAELERIREQMPEHPIVKTYRTRLRVELADMWLQRARGRRSEPVSAADAYDRALSYAPESPDLHLEAARAGRHNGLLERAQTHAAQAIAMQPQNPRALELYAELLADAGKTAQALSAYERAAALEPSNERVASRLRDIAGALRLERPPAQFYELQKTQRLTREELAALLSIELTELIPASDRVPVIVTDMDESWARPFVLDTLAMGLMHARRNHTFGGTAYASFRELERSLTRAAELIGSPVPVEQLLPREHTRYVSGSRAVEAVSRLVAIAKSKKRPRGHKDPRSTSNEGSC